MCQYTQKIICFFIQNDKTATKTCFLSNDKPHRNAQCYVSVQKNLQKKLHNKKVSDPLFEIITKPVTGEKLLENTDSRSVRKSKFDLLLNSFQKYSFFQVSQGFSRFYPISRSHFSPKIKFQAFQGFQGFSRYRGHPVLISFSNFYPEKVIFVRLKFLPLVFFL